jgi:hypothetical protein
MCFFLSKNGFVEKRTSDIVNDSNFDTLRIMNFYMRLHSREKLLLASSCPSARPPASSRSFHLYQLGFDGTDFHESLCWRLSFKFVIKIQIWLQSDKNIGHIICRLKYVLLLSATLNHHKSSVRSKWHQAVIIAEEV